MDGNLVIFGCFIVFTILWSIGYYFDQHKKYKVWDSEDEYNSWEKAHGVDRVKRREK